MSTSQHNTKKPKRRHKTLTIEDKISLLNDLPTCSHSVLCERYGIGRSTISDLKKKRARATPVQEKDHCIGHKMIKNYEVLFFQRTRNGVVR